MNETAEVMAPRQFVESWGPGLARASAAALSDLPLPEASKTFLMDAGLPSDAPAVGFTFTLSHRRLPLLGDVVGNPGGLGQDALSRLRVIGTTANGFVCLDPAAPGRVVCAGRFRHPPVTLLNSGVPQLAAFLLVFRDLRARARQEDEQALRAAASAQASLEIGGPEARRAAAERRVAESAAVRDTLQERAGGMREVFADLRATLGRIDPAAMAEPAGLWPTTVSAMEQMEGLG